MDIALKTLVLIIFILVPGFIFRRVYFQGTFSKQFDSKSWSHSLFYSALFGILLNFIAYYVYEYFFLAINYKACLELYNSISKEVIEDKVVEKFSIISTYKYLSVLYLTSVILGWFIYSTVRNLKLDRYFEPLRFLNHWHYYFTGEVKDFREFTLQNGKCSIVSVDILVKSERDGSNLYSGLLSSCSLDNNGNLESISLTKAKIFKNNDSIRGFKDIPSDVFIVLNSTIQNINLRYTFEEDDDTIIDFIGIIILMLFIFFIWSDHYSILFKYNTISKISLKLFASIIAFFPSLLLYYVYSLSRKQEKKIHSNINETEIAQIKLYNTNIKEARKTIKKEIRLSVILMLILAGTFILIIYLTSQYFLNPFKK